MCAVIGKKLWFTYTFTNKRVKITNSSPLFAKTVSGILIIVEAYAACSLAVLGFCC